MKGKQPMIKKFLLSMALLSLYATPVLCSNKDRDKEPQKSITANNTPSKSLWHELKADAPWAFWAASWAGWIHYGGPVTSESCKHSWETIKSACKRDMPAVIKGLTGVTEGALKLALIDIGSSALLVGGGILTRIGRFATSL